MPFDKYMIIRNNDGTSIFILSNFLRCLEKGQSQRAYNILRRMCRYNKQDVVAFDNEIERHKGLLAEHEKEAQAASHGAYSYATLFKTARLIKTTLLLSLLWFSVALVTYVLSFSMGSTDGWGKIVRQH